MVNPSFNSSNFIYNETLSGVVDGTNKVFTSLNNIESLEDMRLGGVDYPLFSFNGNVVTLQDAPTVGTGAPSIDYFTAGIESPTVVSGKSLWQMIADIYSDIGEKSTSLRYPIDMVRRYILEELPLHLNMKTNPMKKVNNYSFNLAISPTVTSYSATSIPVSNIGDEAPALGKLVIGSGSIISYSTRTTTEFTSLAWNAYSYKEGSKVNIGYKLPTGVKKVSEVYIDGKLCGVVDFRNFNPTIEYSFAVFDGYIFLPYIREEGKVCTIHYVVDTVIPEDDSYNLDFEKEYMGVIRYAVEVKLFTFREDDRLGNVVGIYKDSIKKYKSYISQQTVGTKNVMKSAHFKRF